MRIWTCAWVCALHSQLETAYLRVTQTHKRTLALAAVWQDPRPFPGASARLIFTQRPAVIEAMCVWSTAATGVTIDWRQSSPHSNSCDVPSHLPSFSYSVNTEPTPLLWYVPVTQPAIPLTCWTFLGILSADQNWRRRIHY